MPLSAASDISRGPGRVQQTRSRSMTSLRALIPCTVILLVMGSSWLQAQENVLMKALRDELGRSMEKLQLDGMEKPYYVATQGKYLSWTKHCRQDFFSFSEISGEYRGGARVRGESRGDGARVSLTGTNKGTPLAAKCVDHPRKESRRMVRKCPTSTRWRNSRRRVRHCQGPGLAIHRRPWNIGGRRMRVSIRHR